MAIYGFCVVHPSPAKELALKIKRALVGDGHRICWISPDDFVPGTKHKVDALFMDGSHGNSPAIAKLYGTGRGKTQVVDLSTISTTAQAFAALQGLGQDGTKGKDGLPGEGEE